MSTDRRPSLLLIMGSVRVGRRCPQMAEWIRCIAERSGTLDVELIDLRDWLLPADDEPGIPAQGSYTREHSRAWSAKVTQADSVAIVTPQYNWGYPAPLKNALDRLYAEWRDKPLLIVTYGGHGGGKCAEQLRQVAAGLKMRAVETMPAISVPHEAIKHDTPLNAEHLKPFETIVEQSFAELTAMLKPTLATPQD